jgi:hypothetical protein
MVVGGVYIMYDSSKIRISFRFQEATYVSIDCKHFLTNVSLALGMFNC